MEDSLRMELYEFLRDSIRLEVTMDTEYECEREYVTCSADLSILNPETGEWESLGHDYGSACVGR